jgi:hypothetical protein
MGHNLFKIIKAVPLPQEWSAAGKIQIESQDRQDSLMAKYSQHKQHELNRIFWLKVEVFQNLAITATAYSGRERPAAVSHNYHKGHARQAKVPGISAYFSALKARSSKARGASPGIRARIRKPIWANQVFSACLALAGLWNPALNPRVPEPASRAPPPWAVLLRAFSA